MAPQISNEVFYIIFGVLVLLLLFFIYQENRDTNSLSVRPLEPNNGIATLMPKLIDKSNMQMDYPEVNNLGPCSEYANMNVSEIMGHNEFEEGPSQMLSGDVLGPVVSSKSNWNALVQVRDQGPFGSCTAFAVRYAYLLKQANSGQPLVEPSCAYWYAESRMRLGLSVRRDTGSTVGATMAVLSRYVVVPETAWPYLYRNVLAMPQVPSGTLTQPVVPFVACPMAMPTRRSNWATTEAFLKWIVGRINAGQCVIIAIPVYSNFESVSTFSTGIIPYPAGRYLGGHAICLVGYAGSGNSGTFTFINSWGSYVGYPGGTFTIPWTYVGSFCAEAYAL